MLARCYEWLPEQTLWAFIRWGEFDYQGSFYRHSSVSHKFAIILIYIQLLATQQGAAPFIIFVAHETYVAILL